MTRPSGFPALLQALLDNQLSEAEKEQVVAALAQVLPSVPPGSDMERLIEKIQAAGAQAAATLLEPNSGWTPEALKGLMEPSTNPDHLGRLGPYEVHALISSGGMGVVLEALDTRTGQRVAIKLPAREVLASSSGRQRFYREARNAARINHAHVIRMLSVGQQGDVPYLVMEFVDGETLHQRVEREGQLDWQRVAQIGQQIASGLAAAHRAGIIHRDVKPANLMLQHGDDLRRLKVTITDFGLALGAHDTRVTVSGATVGTVDFMAPEQARGSRVDQRADLFSLGSVLYYLCTGQKPFPGDHALAVLQQLGQCRPQPIEAHNRDIPGWLSAVVERLQQNDPADRYQSAEEVIQALAGPPAVLCPRGRILEPRAGERVPRAIAVEVSLAELPADAHGWLTVDVDGEIWPKKPALLPSRAHAKVTIHEGGYPPVFSISLWQVPARGHRHIEEWFERAPLAGFPGMREIPGATRLDQVQGLTLQ